ncbi:hypothetical protein QL285_017983 [Trifolium repens]|nr:hypothetical protein QL285_017983 [Trifolium repens]
MTCLGYQKCPSTYVLTSNRHKSRSETLQRLTPSNIQGTITNLTWNSECRTVPSKVGTLQNNHIRRVSRRNRRNYLQCIKVDTGKVS